MSYPAIGYAPPIEAKPTELHTQVVTPPPGASADDPLFLRVAEILLAGYAIEKAAKLIAALLTASFGVGVSARSVRAAIGLAKAAKAPHGARPQYKINGLAPDSVGAQAMRNVADTEKLYRAAYVAAAARRMQSTMDDGGSLGEALRREAPHFEAHRAARRRRLDIAGEVGRAARDFGSLLGWYRDPLLDSDADCIAADGANFYANVRPVIGYPGSVHPHCGCTAGPPHATERLVDEAVASLVRRDEPVVRLVPRLAS